MLMMAKAGVIPVDGSDYDRAKEVEEFDETKAGVKSVLASGVVKIPRIFIRPPEYLQRGQYGPTSYLEVPVIDLEGFRGERRSQIVHDICTASETWGFFQMVNHGIPESFMEEMIDGVKCFHEQVKEVKMEWYSRDHERKVRYYSNGDLHVSKAANWRDSIACYYVDGALDSDALPLVCRYFMHGLCYFLGRNPIGVGTARNRKLGTIHEHLHDQTALFFCLRREAIGNYMDSVIRLKGTVAELL